MHANKETGTVQPIEAIGTIARAHGIRFHTDAAQSVGKVATRVDALGAEVLACLDGVAASTGSACHAGRVELSPVLAAMGVSEHVGMGAVYFSLGRGTTCAEIDAVISRLRSAEYSNSKNK